MDVNALRRRIAGTVTAENDPGYENVRRALCWNRLTPARYPRLVAQVASERDVTECVRFARAEGLTVSVRGGGHSWVGFALRDASLLIDLSRLGGITIDAPARTATVQPAVTGRALASRLAAHGLAFPVGHCPSVPLSGFLLNGGLGWNGQAWGPACFSVLAARVVTADGDVVTASEAENTELLWAVRGGGPGFFGVITEYRLGLQTLPRAITTSSYVYPLTELATVGAWAGEVSRRLPPDVELTLFAAPPHVATDAAIGARHVAVLSAVAFLDSEAAAADALAPLARCPVDPLAGEVNEPTTFTGLMDLGAAVWPEGQRYLADTVWSNAPPSDVLPTVRDRFQQAPSDKSLAAYVFTTGGNVAAAPLPDAAFSMAAENLLLCYAIWARPEDDDANRAWHRDTITALDVFAAGHYVGECDIVANPARTKRAFAPASWERLQTLRRRYDPRGLFAAGF